MGLCVSFMLQWDCLSKLETSREDGNILGAIALGPFSKCFYPLINLTVLASSEEMGNRNMEAEKKKSEFTFLKTKDVLFALQIACV